MDDGPHDDLIVALTVQHVKATGEWPKLEVLHRKLHQELGLSVALQDVARRLAPQPFVGGGYSYLGETLALPLPVVARVEEGRRILGAVVAWINLARDRYRSSKGQPTITSGEFVSLPGIDEEVARAVRVLLGGLSDTTDGGHWNDEDWTLTVSDQIVSWPEGLTVDGLLGELERRARRDSAQAAAVAGAHHRMIEEAKKPNRGNLVATNGMQRDPVRVLEGHPVVRGILLVGGIAGGVAAITAGIAWLVEQV